MSARDRILELLERHPAGLDDDALAEALGFPQRQQANARCRELEREGFVERRAVEGKLRNFLVAVSPSQRSRVGHVTAPTSPEPSKPWCWEGNVVGTLAAQLRSVGWTIEFAARVCALP